MHPQGGYPGYAPQQHPGYMQQYAAPSGHPGAYNVSVCVVSCTRAPPNPACFRVPIQPAFGLGLAHRAFTFLTSAWAQQVPGGRGGAAVGRGQPVPHAMHPQAKILKSILYWRCIVNKLGR